MICMLAFICGKCENYTQNIIPYSKNIYNHNKILITVYIVTFLIILPLLLHDVTNSIYFVPSAQDKTAALNNIREINDARLLDADEFLSTYARDTSPSLIRLDVAITVITVSRNRNSPDAYRPQYLKQTVVSLLTGLARHGMAADLSLCNVDADPDAYAEAANMSAYVARTFARFSPTRYVTDEHRLEKEKRDYVYCINETLRRTTAGHVFVLEDDALAHRDMFPLLRYTVERRFTAANSRPAYVKFFHPRWLIGFYSLDSNRLASLWACSTLLAAAAYPVRRWLSRNIGFWACCVYFSLVLISIGRPNIIELRRYLGLEYGYSLITAPSCCTPAMLFPRSSASEICDYLSSIKCSKGYGKDSALDDYISGNTGRRAYYLEPNTFTHIGLYSTIREHIGDPWHME